MKRLLLILALIAFGISARAGTLVQFRTVFGDVEVELLDQEKPITTENFLRYVRENAFENTFFHYQEPDYVIQGGGYRVLNLGGDDERIIAVTNYMAITNEFSVGPLVSNKRGTLAMAKNADPNLATSQFFFNLRDNSTQLDNTNNSGGFTVFGRVVGGTNAFELFNSFVYVRPEGVPRTNLVVGARVFTALPLTLLYFNENNVPEIRLQDFVFVDITTLQVAVRSREDGNREISWNGIASATNRVEFTTGLPSQWQVLTNIVNPTEPRPTVVDSSVEPRRFYRVRTLFPPTGL